MTKHYACFAILYLTTLLLTSCQENKSNATIEQPVIVKSTKIEPLTLDSLLVFNENQENITTFYRNRNFTTAWIQHPLITELLDLNTLIAPYGVALKTQKPILDFETSPDAMLTYDIACTKYFLECFQKIAFGQMNPKDIHDEWSVKEKTVSLTAILQVVAEATNMSEVLKNIEPSHMVYHQLKKAVNLIDKFPDTTFKPIIIADKIQPFAEDPILIPIKERLIYWKDLTAKDSLTTIYDEDTQKAIKLFQKRHGLLPDGIIGKGTIQALNISVKERKQQILANLERWRWYPDIWESQYLIINIPDYQMHLVKAEDTIRSHRIIVGKPSRKTPVLSSKLSYLVFSPTWTIPPTIKKLDVVPATKKDINYLREKQMTVYDRTGAIVLPENWNASEAMGYKYVQSPGAFNSLGLVKFMFHNPFSVYLHDTNNRSLFATEYRALSSGCVRIEKPFELAAYLLDDSEKWPLDSINKVVASRKTKEVNIKQEVHLHILYWTAWSQNDTLHFRPDIYNYDTKIIEKLRY